MSCKSSLQFSTEVIAGDGFQFWSQFPREVTFFKRPDTTSVTENMSIRSARCWIKHGFHVHGVQTLS